MYSGRDWNKEERDQKKSNRQLNWLNRAQGNLLQISFICTHYKRRKTGQENEVKRGGDK